MLTKIISLKELGTAHNVRTPVRCTVELVIETRFILVHVL